MLADAKDILDELGVHFEPAANEAGAAAMLGASINYPLRGAVTWKSTVGTNVASDALSNLASAGVMGGALIVVGEDYGEGASIIQERTHAFAMKSQMWLLDPRPEPADDRRHGRAGLPALRGQQHAGDAGAAHPRLPRARQLRCQGQPGAARSRATTSSRTRASTTAAICLPPSTYAQEKHKIDVRWPAAVRYIREHRLNEVFAGEHDDIGIVLQGGMYNAVDPRAAAARPG